ncbi:glycoside hydrolase family 92 protein [Thermothielavioides terrestris NRRL 8126]|uniref:Glycoside hydrolase family 92 protein n=1 Tax=Thermothielavioides terrestris (strain ATCC 38088 / NRRL 8126) TaxID=578455 RepID=G2QSP3_THETT|nr:glycoside hydrolase family 92 protein [Thermothielavioides terrestris NRRL 8126]AEO64326.1 glycoside hydrolase family 92 protein [Thermothielavioides terrestris NRRL 8126]
MAKPVADTQSHENAAGFVTDENPIAGFSHLHDSGTGGQPSMGNFPLFVHPGCPDDDFAKCAYSVMHRPTNRVPDSVFAAPGYFRINLTNTVQAEMTATAHAALYRFGFSGNATVDVYTTDLDPPLHGVPYSPLVLVDLVDLMNSRSAGSMRVDPATGRVVGHGRYLPSFGAGTYRAFFCADFRGAAIRRTGTFVSNNATEEPKSLDGVGPGFHVPTGSAGVWLQFAPPANNSLLARVGVSFVSVDRACENAEREIGDWHFERVESDARKAWRRKLAAVEVDATGVSEELQTTFWSGLYRTMLSPQNYTGENPLWNSSEPYYDSFYCIWDSFRAQHPLLTIIDPAAQTEMVRALIDIYRHEGKLPDCRMSFCKGFTQGGSNADVVIADAFIKNLTEGVDWDAAYEAVVSDAEVEPKNWGVEGRGNLVSWHNVGYIPWDDTDKNGTGPASRSISRGVEYAYDDYCISLLAAGLNRTADAIKYHRRGANWRNYWNPDQRDTYKDRTGAVRQTAFQGFLQPRLLNGTFHYQAPRACSPVQDMHSCYFDTGLDTYEGSPWLYSFYAPHDMATLVRLMGGPAAFAERLRFFHTSGIAYMGNEQAFLPVFQFHYAARPALSSFFTHAYIPRLFNASAGGIPGNDDCAMGAFSAFAMMGFFPVAGQDVYLLTAPFFPEVRLRARADGRWAVIRVVSGFDPEQGRRIYIQRARLNGKIYTRNWITHEFFAKGGLLELWVGEEEGEWGTAEGDLPPSYYPDGWDKHGPEGEDEV